MVEGGPGVYVIVDNIGAGLCLGLERRCSPPLLIPPRHGGSGRGCSEPRGPRPGSALVRWHVWHERTYSATSAFWPTGPPTRPGAAPANPSKASPERAVVALAERLRAKPAAGGDAAARRLTLPPPVEEIAAQHTGPTLGRIRVIDEGRAVPVRVCRVAEAPEERGAHNPLGARRREARLKFPRRQIWKRSVVEWIACTQ